MGPLSGRLTASKIEVVKKLKEKQFVTSPSVFICYQACIPSKGLSLSILNDYYAFKHAKCVYLYNYSEDISCVPCGRVMDSKQPVTAAMSKNVSPLLQIDVDYLLSVGVEKRVDFISAFHVVPLHPREPFQWVYVRTVGPVPSSCHSLSLFPSEGHSHLPFSGPRPVLHSRVRQREVLQPNRFDRKPLGRLLRQDDQHRH